MGVITKTDPTVTAQAEETVFNETLVTQDNIEDLEETLFDNDITFDIGGDVVDYDALRGLFDIKNYDMGTNPAYEDSDQSIAGDIPYANSPFHTNGMVRTTFESAVNYTALRGYYYANYIEPFIESFLEDNQSGLVLGFLPFGGKHPNDTGTVVGDWNKETRLAPNQVHDYQSIRMELIIPESYYHGLAMLVALFKNSPYVPIYHRDLNTMGVEAVALNQLIISSLSDGPGLYSVMLIMTPMELASIVPGLSGPVTMGEMVMWPYYKKWIDELAVEHIQIYDDTAKDLIKDADGTIAPVLFIPKEEQIKKLTEISAKSNSAEGKFAEGFAEGLGQAVSRVYGNGKGDDDISGISWNVTHSTVGGVTRHYFTYTQNDARINQSFRVEMEKVFSNTSVIRDMDVADLINYVATSGGQDYEITKTSNITNPDGGSDEKVTTTKASVAIWPYSKRELEKQAEVLISGSNEDLMRKIVLDDLVFKGFSIKLQNMFVPKQLDVQSQPIYEYHGLDDMLISYEFIAPGESAEENLADLESVRDISRQMMLEAKHWYFGPDKVAYALPMIADKTAALASGDPVRTPIILQSLSMGTVTNYPGVKAVGIQLVVPSKYKTIRSTTSALELNEMNAGAMNPANKMVEGYFHLVEARVEKALQLTNNYPCLRLPKLGDILRWEKELIENALDNPVQLASGLDLNEARIRAFIFANMRYMIFKSQGYDDMPGASFVDPDWWLPIFEPKTDAILDYKDILENKDSPAKVNLSNRAEGAAQAGDDAQDIGGVTAVSSYEQEQSTHNGNGSVTDVKVVVPATASADAPVSRETEAANAQENAKMYAERAKTAIMFLALTHKWDRSADFESEKSLLNNIIGGKSSDIEAAIGDFLKLADCKSEESEKNIIDATIRRYNARHITPMPTLGGSIESGIEAIALNSVMPGSGPVLDTGYKYITGTGNMEDFKDIVGANSISLKNKLINTALFPVAPWLPLYQTRGAWTDNVADEGNISSTFNALKHLAIATNVGRTAGIIPKCKLSDSFSKTFGVRIDNPTRQKFGIPEPSSPEYAAWFKSIQDMANGLMSFYASADFANPNDSKFDQELFDKIKAGGDFSAEELYEAVSEVSTDDLRIKLRPTEFMGTGPRWSDPNLHSFFDYIAYDVSHRLVKLFPAYHVIVYKEVRKRNELDPTYYAVGRMFDLFHGVSDIQGLAVYNNISDPVSTAVFTMTSFGPSAANMPDPPGFNFISNIGNVIHNMIFADVSEYALEGAQNIMENMPIATPGSRVSIRLGYGTAASRLPLIFNGKITEASPVGTNITVYCAGDGDELVNQLPPAESHIGTTFSGSEPRNILCGFMSMRGAVGSHSLSGGIGASFYRMLYASAIDEHLYDNSLLGMEGGEAVEKMTPKELFNLLNSGLENIIQKTYKGDPYTGDSRSVSYLPGEQEYIQEHSQGSGVPYYHVDDLYDILDSEPVSNWPEAKEFKVTLEAIGNFGATVPTSQSLSAVIGIIKSAAKIGANEVAGPLLTPFIGKTIDSYITDINPLYVAESLGYNLTASFLKFYCRAAFGDKYSDKYQAICKDWAIANQVQDVVGKEAGTNLNLISVPYVISNGLRSNQSLGDIVNTGVGVADADEQVGFIRNLIASLTASNPFGIEHFGLPAIKKWAGIGWEKWGELGQNIFPGSRFNTAQLSQQEANQLPEGSSYMFAESLPFLGFNDWKREQLGIAAKNQVDKTWEDEAKSGPSGWENFKNGFAEAMGYLDYALISRGWSKDELNLKIDAQDKTFWDIANVCARAVPGFVSAVRPFGLRSTLFYGRPYFPLCYSYDYDGLMSALTSSGGKEGYDHSELDLKRYYPSFEKRKPFSQVHYVASNTNLTRNEISINLENVKTIVTGVYHGLEGLPIVRELSLMASRWKGSKWIGDLTHLKPTYNERSTLPVYADISIEPQYQRSAVIDTGIVCDTGDTLMKINPFLQDGFNLIPNNVATSALGEFMSNMYDGFIHIHGNTSINPHDIILLDDFTNDFEGAVRVREVVHQFDHEKGLNTTIVPGLITYPSHDSGFVRWVLALYPAMAPLRGRILKFAGLGLLNSKLFKPKVDKIVDAPKTFKQRIIEFISNPDAFGKTALKSLNTAAIRNVAENASTSAEARNVLRKMMQATADKQNSITAVYKFADMLSEASSKAFDAMLKAKLKNVTGKGTKAAYPTINNAVAKLRENLTPEFIDALLALEQGTRGFVDEKLMADAFDVAFENVFLNGFLKSIDKLDNETLIELLKVQDMDALIKALDGGIKDFFEVAFTKSFTSIEKAINADIAKATKAGNTALVEQLSKQKETIKRLLTQAETRVKAKTSAVYSSEELAKIFKRALLNASKETRIALSRTAPIAGDVLTSNAILFNKHRENFIKSIVLNSMNFGETLNPEEKILFDKIITAIRSSVDYQFIGADQAPQKICESLLSMVEAIDTHARQQVRQSMSVVDELQRQVMAASAADQSIKELLGNNIPDNIKEEIIGIYNTTWKYNKGDAIEELVRILRSKKQLDRFLAVYTKNLETSLRRAGVSEDEIKTIIDSAFNPKPGELAEVAKGIKKKPLTEKQLLEIRAAIKEDISEEFAKKKVAKISIAHKEVGSVTGITKSLKDSMAQSKTNIEILEAKIKAQKNKILKLRSNLTKAKGKANKKIIQDQIDNITDIINGKGEIIGLRTQLAIKNEAMLAMDEASKILNQMVTKDGRLIIVENIDIADISRLIEKLYIIRGTEPELYNQILKKLPKHIQEVTERVTTEIDSLAAKRIGAEVGDITLAEITKGWALESEDKVLTWWKNFKRNFQIYTYEEKLVTVKNKGHEAFTAKKKVRTGVIDIDKIRENAIRNAIKNGDIDGESWLLSQMELDDDLLDNIDISGVDRNKAYISEGETRYRKAKPVGKNIIDSEIAAKRHFKNVRDNVKRFRSSMDDILGICNSLDKDLEKQVLVYLKGQNTHNVLDILDANSPHTSEYLDSIAKEILSRAENNGANPEQLVALKRKLKQLKVSTLRLKRQVKLTGLDVHPNISSGASAEEVDAFISRLRRKCKLVKKIVFRAKGAPQVTFELAPIAGAGEEVIDRLSKDVLVRNGILHAWGEPGAAWAIAKHYLAKFSLPIRTMASEWKIYKLLKAIKLFQAGKVFGKFLGKAIGITSKIGYDVAKTIMNKVFGGPVQLVLCCGASYLGNLLTNWLRNMQAVQIMPLNYRNYPYISGIVGHSGLVYGDFHPSWRQSLSKFGNGWGGFILSIFIPVLVPPEWQSQAEAGLSTVDKDPPVKIPAKPETRTGSRHAAGASFPLPSSGVTSNESLEEAIVSGMTYTPQVTVDTTGYSGRAWVPEPTDSFSAWKTESKLRLTPPLSVSGFHFPTTDPIKVRTMSPTTIKVPPTFQAVPTPNLSGYSGRAWAPEPITTTMSTLPLIDWKGSGASGSSGLLPFDWKGSGASGSSGLLPFDWKGSSVSGESNLNSNGLEGASATGTTSKVKEERSKQVTLANYQLVKHQKILTKHSGEEEEMIKQIEDFGANRTGYEDLVEQYPQDPTIQFGPPGGPIIPVNPDMPAELLREFPDGTFSGWVLRYGYKHYLPGMNCQYVIERLALAYTGSNVKWPYEGRPRITTKNGTWEDKAKEFDPSAQKQKIITKGGEFSELSTYFGHDPNSPYYIEGAEPGTFAVGYDEIIKTFNSLGKDGVVLYDLGVSSTHRHASILLGYSKHRKDYLVFENTTHKERLIVYSDSKLPNNGISLFRDWISQKGGRSSRKILVIPVRR